MPPSDLPPRRRRRRLRARRSPEAGAYSAANCASLGSVSVLKKTASELQRILVLMSKKPLIRQIKDRRDFSLDLCERPTRHTIGHDREEDAVPFSSSAPSSLHRRPRPIRGEGPVQVRAIDITQPGAIGLARSPEYAAIVPPTDDRRIDCATRALPGAVSARPPPVPSAAAPCANHRSENAGHAGSAARSHKPGGIPASIRC